MKGRFSRESYRPAQRFDSVFNIQGGMITDADLNERDRLKSEAIRELAFNTVHDGTPAQNGAIELAGEMPSLRSGFIYADGMRGILRAASGPHPAGPMGMFAHQADLPFGPELPLGSRQVIYADLWLRPVFPLENHYLTDPGLHGAETAIRSRVMTQIKAAPVAARAQIEAGSGAYRRRGNAVLAVTINDAETHSDACDPCAGVVASEQTIPNALFRLEIVKVEGPANAPTHIELAWSEENGAEIAPANRKEELKRDPAVYEYFSETTESHAGIFANWSDAKRSTFVSAWADPPVPALDHDGNPWPFIRRWDGHLRLDLTDGTLVPERIDPAIVFDGDTLKLKLDLFEAQLTLGGKTCLTGDYWLVELRRFAAPAARVRLVTPTPFGIRHQYCVLFTTDAAGAPEAVGDAGRRKLSFPTLTDLPADHVSYDPACPDFYGDVENVQEALDRFCTLDAGDIAFDPAGCPDLYAGASTVEDALNQLCGKDFSAERMLRYLFDWGVVCGIRPKLARTGGGVVSVGGGTILDRAGFLTDFEGGEIDLDNLPAERRHFANAAQMRAELAEEGICLALARNAEGIAELHLINRKLAQDSLEPGFFERTEACIERAKRVEFLADTLEFGDVERRVYTKMILGRTQQEAVGATLRMDVAEFKQAEGINRRFFEQYREIASDEDVARLELSWKTIDQTYKARNVRGSAADNIRAQWATEKFIVMHDNELERRRRCLCETLLPPCPPRLGPPPHFVPIGCIRGEWKEKFLLREVCVYCCRKQALTPRSFAYYASAPLHTLAGQILGPLCCPVPPEEPRQPQPVEPGKGRIWDDFGVDPRRIIGEFSGGATKAADYSAQIDIAGLGEASSRHVLTGYGINVVDAIAIEDIDQLLGMVTNIDPAARLAGPRAQAGDGAVLLMHNGVARDYVIVEHGNGKLPYAEAAAQPAAAVIDTQVIEGIEAARIAGDQLKAELVEIKAGEAALTGSLTEASNGIAGLNQKKNALQQTIAGLGTELEALAATHTGAASALEATRTAYQGLAVERDGLVGQVEGLRTQIGTLTASRDAVTAGVTAASEALSALDTQRRSVELAIQSGLETLGTIEAEHLKFLTTVRSAAPVATVVTDMEFASALLAHRVTTVGELANLSGVQERALKASGVPAANLARLKREAQAFVTIKVNREG